MDYRNSSVSNKHIKKINKNTIFRYILKNKKISKTDIAYALNISLPTVLQNTKELVKEKLIKEVGEFESSGGRKAKAISVIEDARLAIGLDITLNHISLVLVNLLGKIIKHTVTETPFEYSKKYFQSLGKQIDDITKDSKKIKSKILGVGISIPGITDNVGKNIASSHVLGFGHAPGTDFTKHIPFDCLFINDANAAGFAELRSVDESRNVAYLSLSNSVGGAIFFNNSIYVGDNCRGGEFGHMTLTPNGKKCYCGKLGCVDVYCSAKLLSDVSHGKLDLFFDGLDNKKTECVKAWEEYCSYLAIAVNNIRMAFDCDVILGGYVGGYFSKNIKDFRKLVQSLNTFEKNGNYVDVCKYKFEASALGAALQYIESFVNSI